MIEVIKSIRVNRAHFPPSDRYHQQLSFSSPQLPSRRSPDVRRGSGEGRGGSGPSQPKWPDFAGLVNEFPVDYGSLARNRSKSPPLWYGLPLPRGSSFESARSSSLVPSFGVFNSLRIPPTTPRGRDPAHREREAVHLSSPNPLEVVPPNGRENCIEVPPSPPTLHLRYPRQMLREQVKLQIHL